MIRPVIGRIGGPGRGGRAVRPPHARAAHDLAPVVDRERVGAAVDLRLEEGGQVEVEIRVLQRRAVGQLCLPLGRGEQGKVEGPALRVVWVQAAEGCVRVLTELRAATGFTFSRSASNFFASSFR